MKLINIVDTELPLTNNSFSFSLLVKDTKTLKFKPKEIQDRKDRLERKGSHSVGWNPKKIIEFLSKKNRGSLEPVDQ